MNLIRLAAECSCSAQRVAAFRDKLSRARSSNRFDLVVTVPRPRADGRSANPERSHAAFYPWQVWDKKYGPWFRVQRGIGRPSDLERVEREPAPDVEIIPPPPGL
jgi:hypothetical protein